MPIKLSICIPTYNRAALLDEALQSIASQSRPGLEIVVCDNASSDNTRDVIDRFRPHFEHLVYFRWPENMGPDRNVLKTVEIASGEYCWLLGDDDQLEVGALDKVVPVLDDGYDLVYVNAMTFDSEMKLSSGQTVNRFDCSTADETLVSLSSWITFLSSVCIRRDAFMQHYETVLGKIGTGFAHCYAVVGVMQHGKNQILPEPLVRFRAGNTGGYNIYTVFLQEFGRIMDYCAAVGFSQQVVLQVRTRNVYQVVVPALLQIKLGKLGLKSNALAMNLFHSGLGVREKLILGFLSLCPAWVYRAAQGLRHLMRR